MIDNSGLWQAEADMTDRPSRLSVLTALLDRRTWSELLYALAGLPIGVATFSYTVTAVSLSVGMMVTLVGLPLLALTQLGARGLGNGLRGLANGLTGSAVEAPAPLRPRPGLLGWIGSSLSDPVAWRAQVYLVLKLPLGMLTFVVATVFYGYGVGGVTYPIWQPLLPCQSLADGGCHRGVTVTDSYHLDTFWQITVTAVVGLLLLLLAPWAVRAAVRADRLLAEALLGPSRTAARVLQLERTRAQAVDDAAGTLRRIERDLHDGTQARLVALAMNVGLAKAKLDEGGDPAEARALLETAHATAKDAIVEVRDLARGIHPPVLDAGLDSALATLAAHSAVPVELTTSIADRPPAAIETIAYFCAAELLANVAKHSGARRASVDVRTAGSVLRLRVEDDGHGGARVGAGSGLSGLRERTSTVDGRITVSSPPGGPTVVTVDLPLRTEP